MPPNRAIDKFQKGQRVSASTKGVQHGCVGSGQLGTVTGFGRRDARCVYVLRDGRKMASAYHMSFWDVLQAPEVP